MTYTIQWSSQINGDTGTTAPDQIGKSTISLPDNSTDNSTSITLTGKGLSGYGRTQQENFIQLMENFASQTAPTDPTVGQLWFDTASGSGTETLKVYKITTPGTTPVLDWSVIWPVATSLGYTPYDAANPAGYLNASTIGTAIAGDGTEKQVIVSSSSSGVTLSTPQAIDSAASPTFVGVTITGTPTNATDATTKAYVDSSITGLTWKNSVVTATTANITLSGEQSIDGIVTSSSRVLVKNQTDQTQNGIYNSGSGSWARTLDADSGAELVGAALYVEEGTTQGGFAFTCTNSTVTIGTTNITFVQFGGGQTYSAGTGLSLTGNTFANTGVTKASAGTGISIAPTGGTGNITVTNSGVTSIAGTTNQINVSANTGGVTLSLPSTISASITGNAATVGGFTPSQSSGVGSRVVVADSSGYINNTYFNSTDNSVSSGVSSVMVKAGDNYHRSATAQAVASFISGASMNISGNASTANSATSASTSTTRSTSDNSTNIATTAFVQALVGSASVTTGTNSVAITFANGYTIQMGFSQGTKGSANEGAVYCQFPKTFPNAFMGGVCSTHRSSQGTNGSSYIMQSPAPTTSYMYCWFDQNDAGTYWQGYWIAWGY